jgi:hypothetical protein
VAAKNTEIDVITSCETLASQRHHFTKELMTVPFNHYSSVSLLMSYAVIASKTGTKSAIVVNCKKLHKRLRRPLETQIIARETACSNLKKRNIS